MIYPRIPDNDGFESRLSSLSIPHARDLETVPPFDLLCSLGWTHQHAATLLIWVIEWVYRVLYWMAPGDCSDLNWKQGRYRATMLPDIEVPSTESGCLSSPNLSSP
jgi:hypothetical protein